MKGLVVWITGLPSSGKSLLAERLWRRLVHAKKPAVVLDGDVVRGAIKPTPGYDEASRADFYETLASLAALMANQGLTVLVPATSHLRVYRQKAREVSPSFLEVYVLTSPEVCAKRDAKGLYAAVANGEVSGLPGVDLAYEVPESPEVVALGGYDEEALAKLLKACHA